jgi:hypothetical protein
VSLQWTEVDPSEFEDYPDTTKQRAPDELDDVMAAIQAGRTVELTLDDEKAVRGRRMALGRRAKSRGFPIQMRYRDNRIIVRRATDNDTATDAPLQSQPATEGDGSTAAAQPRRSRSRKSA